MCACTRMVWTTAFTFVQVNFCQQKGSKVEKHVQKSRKHNTALCKQRIDQSSRCSVCMSSDGTSLASLMSGEPEQVRAWDPAAATGAPPTPRIRWVLLLLLLRVLLLLLIAASLTAATALQVLLLLQCYTTASYHYTTTLSINYDDFSFYLSVVIMIFFSQL